MIKNPQTLVKVGRYDNPLEEAVRRFREPLTSVQVGLGNTIKYATFKEAEEPYLLMVSQQKNKLVTSAGYNVILTVTSYSEDRNRKIAHQFETETRISLDLEVPEQLKRHFMMMNMSFSAFEKNPGAAMAVLRGEL